MFKREYYHKEGRKRSSGVILLEVLREYASGLQDGQEDADEGHDEPEEFPRVTRGPLHLAQHGQ